MSSASRRFFTELNQILFRQPGLSGAAEPLIQRVFPWFSAGFYAAKIVQISHEAGCLRLKLKVSRWYPQFTPGQHLQLRLVIGGIAMERTFSICSAIQQLHEQRELELAIKIQPQGRFTGALAGALTAGSYVHLSAPAGNFALPQGQACCLLAAGCGVTPLFSMLSSLSRLTAPLLFIYSYRGQDQQLFAGQWAALQARFPLLHLVLWDSSECGRLTAERLFQQFSLQSYQQFRICGPLEFTRSMQTALQAQGIQSAHIDSESFGVAGHSRADVQPVQLQLGREIHQLAGQGSLLHRAEHSGLTLRYGCRRGVCMQCLCEKKSGVVRNLLTGEESDAGPGLIRLCISEAVSAVTLSGNEVNV